MVIVSDDIIYYIIVSIFCPFVKMKLLYEILYNSMFNVVLIYYSSVKYIYDG